MGLIGDFYDSAMTFIGEEVFYPALKGAGYTDAELSSRDTGGCHLFHNLADVGQETHAYYKKGEIIEGAATAITGAGYAPVDATGRYVVDEFNNAMHGGSWNNMIAAVVATLVGSIIGNAAGGGLTGIGLTLGAGVVGYLFGDKIMDAMGSSVESKALPELAF